MKGEYTTEEIWNLSNECGHDKKWMKRKWKPINVPSTDSENKQNG